MRTLEGTLGQYKNCMCVGFFMYPLRQMDVSVLASISWCLSLSVPSCPLSLSGRSGKSFLCSGLCFLDPLRKVNERKRYFKKRECERDVGSGNKRWESTAGEERADGYWSKKAFKKKKTSLLKREYYRDLIRGINPYIISALPETLRNSVMVPSGGHLR